jgi:peptidyl-prolyl cis-trans isomerase SurA
MKCLLNKMVKFFLLIFWGATASSVAAFSFNAQAAEPLIIDRIVAVVNDEIITLFDLNQILKPYEKNLRAQDYSPEDERQKLFKLRSEILNNMIDQKLADQQIKKYKIEASEQEINMTIERIKESRSLTDEDLRAKLAEEGITLEEFRENLKQQLLRSKLVNREIKSKIAITDEEIEKYYNDHIEKYVVETKYHLWTIFIRFSWTADESERQMAFEKMQTVLNQLKQGRSFESLANETPDSPKSPEAADLGLYRLDELSPQLQNIVKEMKEGQHSSILNTTQGYQILYVQKIVVTDSKNLSDAKSEIEDILYNEAIDNRYKTWLSELRKRSHIRVIN